MRRPEQCQPRQGNGRFDYVGGYCISNDVSERDFQLLRSGQWDKGKNCETFNPLGPLLVTSDEIDPTDLALTTVVNGVPRQSESTADMVVGVAGLVRYISQFMVLYPGDVINTGTPAGVALGQPDPSRTCAPATSSSCPSRVSERVANDSWPPDNPIDAPDAHDHIESVFVGLASPDVEHIVGDLVGDAQSPVARARDRIMFGMACRGYRLPT